MVASALGSALEVYKGLLGWHYGLAVPSSISRSNWNGIKPSASSLWMPIYWCTYVIYMQRHKSVLVRIASKVLTCYQARDKTTLVNTS